MHRITLIGAGRLAWSFAAALNEKGLTPAAVIGRTPEHNKELAAYFGITIHSTEYSDIPSYSDIIIILVPDSAVTSAALALANSRADLHGVTVFHCSGVLGSEALTPVYEKGALTASVQIVQTFPTHQPVSFTGVPAYIETDHNDTFHLLERLCSYLGLITGRITTPEKKALHTASVFVCNFLTGNLFAAQSASGKYGNEFIQAFFPILKQTIINAETQGIEHSLSGPALRGDSGTLLRHLNELSGLPAEKSTALIYSYKAQTELLFMLMEHSAPLTPEQIAARETVRAFPLPQ